MANETVTQPVNEAQDGLDNLQKKTGQLHAMLQMTFGEARETFDSMNENLRDDFMWACADIAHDCEALASKLTYQRLSDRQTEAA